MNRVLAICAHPDDETLGCGGALLKHAAAGDELHWIISTAPLAPLFDDAFRQRRRGQIDAVAAAYGFTSVQELGFPAAGLDAVAMGAVISAMVDAVRRVQPDIVYLLHAGDVHADHRVTATAAWVALKPMGRHTPREVLAYETLSSTNLAMPGASAVFEPTRFCDIGAFIDRKLDILHLYEGEIHQPPHPRSAEAVRALARFRGASVGLEHAEAFLPLRQIF